MSAVLEVTLDEDLELEDFSHNFTRMFGAEVMEQVVGSVTGKVRFSGLTKTSMQLEGIEPHLRKAIRNCTPPARLTRLSKAQQKLASN